MSDAMLQGQNPIHLAVMHGSNILFHNRSPDLLTSNSTEAAMCMKDNKVIAIEGCIMLRCNVCMHELHWLCISCCAFPDVKELAGSQFKDSIPSTGILVTKF